ncbi:DUF167 family protein [Rheinheimera texasensis]|uniref:DUF167 family protein n=1 Tax=Rheinheimera texasensis TaxID=306205 RepID=UPI0004E13786|nr:DUF167 family protein [Rheinheimera texasensis]
MTATPWCWLGADLQLQLYIQPKASRDQVVGLHCDAIKIAITAPPVDGKANAHVLKLLAQWFGVAKSQVELQRGELSRHKQWLIRAPGQIPPAFAVLGLAPKA